MLHHPVGPRVLVAEAASDLEVPLEPGDHQELLQLLRRLRQRVEAARDQPAWDQEVAGTFRRALDEDGGLDFEEVPLVEEVANVLHDTVPERHHVEHPPPSQVHEAVLEPEKLVHLRVFVHVERRSLGAAEHCGTRREDLDGARGQLGVLGPFRTALDTADDLHDPLVPERFGNPVGLGGEVGIEDNLNQPVAVAEVYEDETAMIPPSMDPARQGNLCAGVLRPETAAADCL